VLFRWVIMLLMPNTENTHRVGMNREYTDKETGHYSSIPSELHRKMAIEQKKT